LEELIKEEEKGEGGKENKGKEKAAAGNGSPKWQFVPSNL